MGGVRVTVGIPTFNRANLLREAVESVLAQTFADVRVLVSDNASTDDTADVVASIRDERVDYVRADRNLGVIPNFNRLIDLSDSEYFVLLPDDDILYPEHLESTVDVLESFENVGIVHTAFDLIDADSRVIRGISPLGSRRRLTIERGERYLERSMTSNWPVCFSSVLYRRRALLDADRFRADEEPFADLPLWMRIAVDWDFAYVARPLVGFRMHPGTVTLGIGEEAGATLEAQDRTRLLSDVRNRRRMEFLGEASLPRAQKAHLRSLAAMQYVVERANLGAPWVETMKATTRLVGSRPTLLLRPFVWRFVAAQLGGRRLRLAVRALRSRPRG
jgi:glycosyltransferase involved in cell wall biosynthesis